MSADWLEKIAPAFIILAGIGAAITAYATSRIWRISRRAAMVSQPTISASALHRSKSPDRPHKIEFSVDNEHLAKWGVISVVARPFWRLLISEIGSLEPDVYGGTKRIAPKRWTRRIKYDPSTHSSTILIRYDCPDFVNLVFKLAMRSSPSETSRFPMRIKIRD